MVFHICFRLSNVFKINCWGAFSLEFPASAKCCWHLSLRLLRLKTQRLLQNLLKTLLSLYRTVDLKKVERLPWQRCCSFSSYSLRLPASSIKVPFYQSPCSLKLCFAQSRIFQWVPDWIRKKFTYYEKKSINWIRHLSLLSPIGVGSGYLRECDLEVCTSGRFWSYMVKV